MILAFIVFAIAIVITTVLESTVMHGIAFYDAIPDLSLVVLINFGFYFGRFSGQLLGAFSGLLMDIVYLAPPGFNLFVRTLIGFIAGSIKEIVRLDFILLPMAITAIFLLTKYLITIILSLIIGNLANIGLILSVRTLFELLYTTLVSPLLFLIFNRTIFLLKRRTYD